MHQAIGTHPKWDNNDESLLQNIATNHAKLHILGEKYYQSNPEDHKESDGFDLLENGLGKTVFELRKESFENYSENNRISTNLNQLRQLKINLPNSLPLGYIHGDFDETNFLVDQNKISAILDFDDLRIEPIINCLSVISFTILKYSRDPLEVLTKYLQFYKEIRPLNSHEIVYLKDCIKITGYFYFLWEMKTARPEKDILKCLDDLEVVDSLNL
jgi:Ser/Thr protein kinase RdoA (MazF antagonist)